MIEFEKQWQIIAGEINSNAPLYWCEAGWKAALEFYKDTADECEKDCITDEDYRILYFHLKQVLTNELQD